MALGLVIMGIGMACTTAPATNAIISSVPLSKSGVGSAVNDTTREVGGALGIAVLGSLVSSAYRSTMADKVAGLPAELAGQARDSVGGAFKVGQEPGRRRPPNSPLTAKVAFTDAMGTALVVAAVVALLCAGIVLVFFPRTPVAAPGAPVGDADADAPTRIGRPGCGRARPSAPPARRLSPPPARRRALLRARLRAPGEVTVPRRPAGRP